MYGQGKGKRSQHVANQPSEKLDEDADMSLLLIVRLDMAFEMTQFVDELIGKRSAFQLTIIIIFGLLRRMQVVVEDDEEVAF
ncbi:hypothetical protein PGTUg99_003151 [Puccinia graminis f. sp. tritici]|uniref:Uncharacterized protein n=1 Tax=Puccinia graminis f. sp. tritici TaxID=56615 RepID=A0A5B0M7Q0_PUCGR|nr:hypothetical protein PGTUg99_003151 [Puccinia graminis f. sp. tritici]